MNFVIEMQRLNKRIDLLQDAVQRRNWNNLRKEDLVKELQEAIGSLKEVQDSLQENVQQVEKTASVDYLKADEFFREFKKTLEFLERNLKMEKEKSKETPMQEINIFETSAVPELYAEMQRKILGTIIKTRFLAERLGIAAQKQETKELEKKSVARKVMELLEEREDELQALKEKYADVRRKSFLGMVQEKNVVDLEEKLMQANIGLEKIKDRLEGKVKDYSIKLLGLQKEFIELNREKKSLEQAFEKYLEESNELIPMLKKERDYAKKLVLDIENESLRLRERYSRELMGFEKAKQEVKEETEEKYERVLRKLREEMVGKDRMLMQLKKTVDELLIVKGKEKKRVGKSKKTLRKKVVRRKGKKK